MGYREKDNPEFRYEYLDDMIGTIGRGILGLTVNCARCHNHKFDPIAEGLLQVAGVVVSYVEMDYPLAPKEEAGAYERKNAEVTSRLRCRRRSGDRGALSCLVAGREVQEVSRQRQRAIAIPEEKRTPGQVLLANQVIRTSIGSSAEIDRVMTPEDLDRKKRLLAVIERIEKERPKPLPVAMGLSRRRLSFYPGWSRR